MVDKTELCVAVGETEMMKSIGVILHPYGSLSYAVGEGGVVEIRNIVACSEHRREGIGRKLLEKLKSKCSKDIYTVFAFCREENRIGRQWYDAMGFCLYHLPDFYGKGENAYCCTLSLSK